LDPNTVQDSATKVNMRLSLIPASDAWAISLVGKNLTDEITASTSNDVPFGNGSYYSVTDRTRSVVLEGKLKF